MSIREDLENIINKTYLYARGAKKDYSCTEAVKELETYINKVREEAVRDFVKEISIYYDKKNKEGAGIITGLQRQMLGETRATKNARHQGFLSALLVVLLMAEAYLKSIKEDK